MHALTDFFLYNIRPRPFVVAGGATARPAASVRLQMPPCAVGDAVPYGRVAAAAVKPGGTSLAYNVSDGDLALLNRTVRNLLTTGGQQSAGLQSPNFQSSSSSAVEVRADRRLRRPAMQRGGQPARHQPQSGPRQA